MEACTCAQAWHRRSTPKTADWSMSACAMSVATHAQKRAGPRYGGGVYAHGIGRGRRPGIPRRLRHRKTRCPALGRQPVAHRWAGRTGSKNPTWGARPRTRTFSAGARLELAGACSASAPSRGAKRGAGACEQLRVLQVGLRDAVEQLKHGGCRRSALDALP